MRRLLRRIDQGQESMMSARGKPTIIPGVPGLLAEVILPDGGTAEREPLWNAVEQAEKRINSTGVVE